MSYQVLAQPVVFEEVIKKSRFITYLQRVDSLDQARDFLQTIKREHPKAVHHCWAVVAGRPNDSNYFGFSDDGEPTGTAGKPMLTVLMNSNIGNIMSVCVRYFGGVLLGTGGLVRAYSSGTANALKLAQTELRVDRSDYFIICPYNQVSMVTNLLEQVDAVITTQDFTYEVRIDFALEDSKADQLGDMLTNRSGGTLFLYRREAPQL